MKFREPLEITCPNCGYRFERPLAWICQQDQRCPECRGSLASIRNNIVGMVTDWTHFVEDVERILAIESEFSISIPDADAENLRTFGDAHDYLLRSLVPDGRADPGAQQIWGRLCSAIAAVPDFGTFAQPTRNDRLIRTMFTQKAT